MTLRRAVVCLFALLLLPLRSAETPLPAAAQPSLATSAATAVPATPPVPTVIESGAAEMVSTEKETTFTFTKGVKVTATNMTLTCSDLVVVAVRGGDPSATIGNQQNFKSLIATGGVRIVQNDREALAERAEVFPGEDKVILSGNPVVRSIKDGWEQNGQGMQLVLYRGERRAVLEGPQGTRARLIMPPLKDLGYDVEKEKGKEKAQPPAKAGSTPAPAPAPGESTTPTIRVPIPNLPR